MDRTAYTETAGPLGVLNDAVSIPPELSEAACGLFFGHAGDVVSQEMGFNCEIYSAVGTVPLHFDEYFDPGAEGFCAMALVLVNDGDFCLTDGANILPIPAGSVFRHDPCGLHGTCRPDGSTKPDGRLVFLSVDFDLSRDPEDDPTHFAQWALEDAMEKLRVHTAVDSKLVG
jgi:hypothetical protein